MSVREYNAVAQGALSQPTTGEWTPEFVMLVREGCEAACVDFDTKIADGHNASLAAAALEIKSLKAVEANYNETHQILTNIGVKHEGMDVAFRVNAAIAAEREKRAQAENALQAVNGEDVLQTQIERDLLRADRDDKAREAEQLREQLAAEKEKHHV